MPTTFTTSKSEQEIVELLNQTFEVENINRELLQRYWDNLAHFFIQVNGRVDVPRMNSSLISVTTVSFAPKIYRTIPQFLPKWLKEKIYNYRLTHLDRYSHLIPFEDLEAIIELHTIFSTLVFLVCDNDTFVQEFVEYTEIPIKDGEEPALI